ncbi:hypothetical protein [Enterocloster bolteae]|uniref:hypothetical protein n=1 Tax=Enterocloster bolteae TaxID=208479 RepID=UPI001FA93931|nr:hypothetical protein [Enterocloster bolteae]
MRLNETKMQIKMGEQEMNIRMLAEKSGVSRQTISCIKAGKKLFSGGSVQVSGSSWNEHGRNFESVGRD